MKIHVFDVDKLSRSILDPTWPILAAKKAQHGPKMGPSKRSKIGQKWMSKNDENVDRHQDNLAGNFLRSGGMRGPSGGIIGGYIDTQIDKLQLS